MKDLAAGLYYYNLLQCVVILLVSNLSIVVVITIVITCFQYSRLPIHTPKAASDSQIGLFNLL